jgi:hypothetical protein
VVIFTPANASPSSGSLNPKSAAAKAYSWSSVAVTVLSAPDGASFTGVTLTVMVLAEGSRSTPLLAVPPSSCTWKPKLA